MPHWVGNHQIFGCDTSDDINKKCNPRGVVKAKIFMDKGLRIKDYNTNVYLLRTTPNGLDTIRPKNYYTTIKPGNCDSGAYYFYWDLDSTLR
ncbi:MAG: hypothetical protein IPP29_08150 [Bacteroidetes bacterium]|nr:hypothetical protein [Bacteroidota bacterium]